MAFWHPSQRMRFWSDLRYEREVTEETCFSPPSVSKGIGETFTRLLLPPIANIGVVKTVRVFVCVRV